MKKNFMIQSGYLHIPVSCDATKHYLRVTVDGEQVHELHIGITNEPQFYCAMSLCDYLGKTVVLSIDDGAEKLLDGILEGGPIEADNPLYSGLYHEQLRPAYHFSSRRGWLNDPNGLFFDGKHYHLYYQHNPYGILHGGVNIHWGHAISKDAVHWVELDDAIKPANSNWHIASGSAILDTQGAAGFGKGAVIAAYTALGSMDFHKDPPCESPSYGQYLAYSTNGGNTFKPFPNNPHIPTEDYKSWRDPRLFEYPQGEFTIAVYETTERGNCVSFYHSTNLHNWVQTSRVDDLYECPDLIPLVVQETKEEMWVLYGADGMYRVGRFKEGSFIQTEEKQPMDFGDSTYAGQTWTGTEGTDSRLHISWVRGMGTNNEWSGDMGYPGMPFSQCMSVPCLLTLHKTSEGYRLFRSPAPALNALHTADPERNVLMVSDSQVVPLHGPEDVSIRVEANYPVTLKVGRINLLFDPSTGKVVFDGTRSVNLAKRDSFEVRLLVDRTTVEFFVQGEISATYAMDTEGAELTINAVNMKLELCRHSMGSIWP